MFIAGLYLAPFFVIRNKYFDTISFLVSCLQS